MSACLRRLAASSRQLPFLAGAHCKEDCGPRRAACWRAPPGAHALRPGVFPHPLVAPPAPTPAPFERREVRVDAFAPGRGLHQRPRRALLRLDGGSSRPATAATATGWIAVLEQAGQVPLFDDPAISPRPSTSATTRASSRAIGGPAPGRRASPSSWGAASLGPAIPRPAGAPSAETRRRSRRRRTTSSAGCGDGRRQDEEECDDGNASAATGAARTASRKPR